MKRTLLALLLLGAAVRAQAIDWTGIWNSPDPNKQGFGYNFVQADNYIFGTFYVYGLSGGPAWLVAGLTLDAAGNYTGTLYAANGTFFGLPWNPAAYGARVVGTASFKPSTTNNYQGVLTYTSNDPSVGVGTSTVAIERQYLGPIATGGTYTGGQVGAYTGCTDPAGNYGYTDSPSLTITHLANGSATYAFTYLGSLTCTIAGTYVPHGQYYDIPNATYTCSDGLNTTANMTEIKQTSLGIEGRLSAPVFAYGAGCTENASFSAVFVQ